MSEINDICDKFSSLRIKRFNWEDYYYNEPYYKRILAKTNQKIKIFLNKHPYSYINNKKFTGIIEEKDTVLSWEVTVTLYNPLKNINKIKYFCFVKSLLPANRRLKKLNYFAYIKIKRLNFSSLKLN